MRLRTVADLSPETFGYFLSFIGVCFAICNAIVVPLAAAHMSNREARPHHPRLLLMLLLLLLVVVVPRAQQHPQIKRRSMLAPLQMMIGGLCVLAMGRFTIACAPTFRVVLLGDALVAFGGSLSGAALPALLSAGARLFWLWWSLSIGLAVSSREVALSSLYCTRAAHDAQHTTCSSEELILWYSCYMRRFPIVRDRVHARSCASELGWPCARHRTVRAFSCGRGGTDNIRPPLCTPWTWRTVCRRGCAVPCRCADAIWRTQSGKNETNLRHLLCSPSPPPPPPNYLFYFMKLLKPRKLIKSWATRRHIEAQERKNL
eukprot:SAG11_NODE_2790_length_2969_cov_1.817073_2_plen_317_part_00